MSQLSDLSAIMATAGEPVTLSSGSVVYGIPSVATTEDALSGDAVVAGRTRTLRFNSADVPLLEEGQTLTWSARGWRVVRLQLAAGGRLTRAFLGTP